MHTSENAGAVGPEAQYFANLDRGQFLIQRCRGCARHVFYPRVNCPHCGGTALEWTEPSGTGRVYSVSVVAGRGDSADYAVALIDLDEGVRLMSHVEGIAQDAVRIGMRVRARVRVENGKGLLVFQPEAA